MRYSWLLVSICVGMQAMDTTSSSDIIPADFFTYLQKNQFDDAAGIISTIAQYVPENIRLYKEQLTLLHVACAYRSSYLAKTAIIDLNEDFSMRDIYGNTPLMYNGYRSHHGFRPKEIRYMVSLARTPYVKTGYAKDGKVYRCRPVYPETWVLNEGVSFYNN